MTNNNAYTDFSCVLVFGRYDLVKKIICFPEEVLTLSLPNIWDLLYSHGGICLRGYVINHWNFKVPTISPPCGVLRTTPSAAHYNHVTRVSWCLNSMMTSSNGNVFRVTGPLCGEFTGHRWIPLTKASDAGLWRFLWSAPEQTVE